MRELTLEVPKPQMRINGTVFDVRMSDLDIYLRSQELFDKWDKAAKSGKSELSPKQMLALLKEFAGFIDELLGDGAVAKISGGVPVSMAMLMDWVGKIAKDAAEHYEALITDE